MVAEYAGLGVLSYGVIAVLLEGAIQGVRLMWWALSEIGKSRLERQQRLEEVRKEGLEQGLEQGRADAEVRIQTDPEYRRQVLGGVRPSARRRRIRRRPPSVSDAGATR